MKTCGDCKLELPASAFNTKKGTQLQAFCRECQHKRHRAWYQKNRVARKAQINERKLEMRDSNAKKLEELKRAPCLDCGARFDPVQMDFVHVRGKTRTISRLIREGASWGRIETEVKMCDLVCANCHRARVRRRVAA